MTGSSPTSVSATKSAPDRVDGGGRRGDLDALRGMAMLLGIVLHTTLAYFPAPWPVQDPRQSASLALLYAAIHGFRMQLFFLLSGFFVMRTLRHRGLRQLVEQRALRVLLPLALSLVTILPLNRAVMAWAVGRGAAAAAASRPLTGAILAGDPTAVRGALAAGADATAWEPASGLTPLALAAMTGNAAVVEALLDAGVPIGSAGRDGSTALHAAAFAGQAEMVQRLLDRGADPAARNAAGRTAMDALGSSAEMAILAERFLGLPQRDSTELILGRERARANLAPRTPIARLPLLNACAARYQAALMAPWLSLRFRGQQVQIFGDEVFDHLWFLSYLGWLVAVFAVVAAIGVVPTGRHRWWLVPATILPQALMWFPFGPDTALGLLPTPHLFFYYGCFFWFGAALFAVEGPDTPRVTRWAPLVPVSLLLLFPLGIATIGNLSLSAVIQSAYAWGMTLGCIGVFRKWCVRPSTVVRWLADASYWMYLIHVPLVILFQALLRDEPWPAALKMIVVITMTIPALLVSYAWLVRDTPIGWLLNGPRFNGPRA